MISDSLVNFHAHQHATYLLFYRNTSSPPPLPTFLSFVKSALNCLHILSRNALALLLTVTNAFSVLFAMF